MKSIKSLILLMGLSFIVNSCKKDDSDTPEKNLCENVTCLNGGTCVDGSCDCPEGYSGSNCATQLTPNIIKINSIDVLSIPIANSGGYAWDIGSSPDLYVKIDVGGSTLFNSGYYSNTYLDCNFECNVNISNPFANHTIYLYDYDDVDPDDLIGAFTFYPYSNTGGFPTEIMIQNSASTNLNFRLNVDYIW